MSDKADYNIYLFGETSVKAYEIMIRFVQGIYPSKYDRTLENIPQIKKVPINGKEVPVEIIDGSCSISLPTAFELFVHQADGIALVYSITNYSSFELIKDLIPQLNALLKGKPVRTMVIGVNSTQESNRVVPFNEGKQFADSIGALFEEMDAKAEVNVNAGMYNLIQAVVADKKESKKETSFFKKIFKKK